MMTIPQVPMQLLTNNNMTTAELHIMGDITRGHWLFGKQPTDTDASDVAQALIDLPPTVGEITVHINSFGGEVAEGMAIYNALKAHKAKVTTVCEGFACSIASVVFMAGSKRVMRPASMLMLHNASMSAQGDSNALRKASEDLAMITELSKTAYLEHATDALTREALDEIMDAETWVKPDTALEWGLATEVDAPEQSDEPSQSAAALVMGRLGADPEPVQAQGAVVAGLTQEQIADIAERVAARIVAPCHETEPAQVMPAEPAPAGNPSERIARLFGSLAKSKV